MNMISELFDEGLPTLGNIHLPISAGSIDDDYVESGYIEAQDELEHYYSISLERAQKIVSGNNRM